LYSVNNAELTVAELLTMSLAVDVSLSECEVENIEHATHGQSANKVWFDYSAKRVTASRIKSMCCTDVDKPFLLLLSVKVHMLPP